MILGILDKVLHGRAGRCVPFRSGLDGTRDLLHSGRDGLDELAFGLWGAGGSGVCVAGCLGSLPWDFSAHDLEWLGLELRLAMENGDKWLPLCNAAAP